jgi:hypothetical protein
MINIVAISDVLKTNAGTCFIQDTHSLNKVLKL